MRQYCIVNKTIRVCKFEKSGRHYLNEVPDSIPLITDIEWMDGIKLPEHSMALADAIFEAGEAVYLAKQKPLEEYVIELEQRIAKLEGDL
jgi:hypothetical protein